MVCRAQVRTGLGKSDRPGSQGGFEKRGQSRLWRSGARTQFRARQPHARFDGRGLETERYGVTAPAPDPTMLLDICHRDWVWIGVDEFVYRLDAEAIGGAAPTGTGRALDDLPVELLGRGQRR